jgi:DnaJ-domain-containing protein 1
MKGKGKLIGLLVGLLFGASLRRPWLLLIGVALGHFYDMGAFGKGTRGQDTPPAADPYAVLGIARDASDDEVEQAWRRRMQEYHPDRVANAAPELRELAERRAREANAAWETIRRQRHP